MKQMKKLLASALLLTGCTGGTSPEGSSTASGEESSTVSQAPLTDEDILAEANEINRQRREAAEFCKEPEEEMKEEAEETDSLQ